MKKCSKCKRELDSEMFYKSKRYKSGLLSACKECGYKYHKEDYQNNKEKINNYHRKWQKNNIEKWKGYQKEYRQNNKEKISKIAKEYNLSSNYGLTVEKYNEMATNQNNKCLLCLGETRLVVDHCHETGNVRGLLCNNCNQGLGLFKDNINNLGRAIEYLALK